MKFELVNERMATPFLVEDSALAGVKRIANIVAKDIELVTGKKPEMIQKPVGTNLVIVGTLGQSEIIESLHQTKKINCDSIRGKREVFLFQLVENPMEHVEKVLVVVGSDKRGTIYGLFHISELLGVSPFIYWGDVKPEKKNTVVFDETVNMVSKEPSVKYRGFFINDEWPAFGTWTFEQFGGFTSEMYEHVFEVLLRLKGNYLWPAMWSSSFYLDGPGLANAELADEMGVIIGLSHHEPCLRNSEEWDLVKGEDTEFGSEWNYATNEQGLINYWRTGLERCGKFENVITIGMRGERDSSMLGEDATVEENILLLKSIIKKQRELIKETVTKGEKEVPMMLALYKEVEAYFYGDDTVQGLMDYEELDGVTFMLCEDNFGNLRTLPRKDMRDHKGGYGMYYHFDYHGGPISYEWVNSTYLPKVWEQMTMAYESGIQELWIVNVGDLKFQELPLNYFMDLAYDFERFGTNAPNTVNSYLENWVHTQFGSTTSKDLKESIIQIIKGYTKLSHNRKPEAMNCDVYDPIHENEVERILIEANRIEGLCDKVLVAINEDRKDAYYEMIYYPAKATCNVHKIHLYAAWNHYYASKGRVDANDYGQKMAECIELDRKLTEEFHQVNHGKWHGMALSEHIGFQYWNEEECAYPIRMYVEPANKSRLFISVQGSKVVTAGMAWTKKELVMDQFMRPDMNESYIELAPGSMHEMDYKIICNESFIICSQTEGTLTNTTRIKVSVDRSKVQGAAIGKITVKSEAAQANVIIHVVVENVLENIKEEICPMMFVESNGVIAMEAEHYYSKQTSLKNEIVCLEEFGRTLSGMKVFPQMQEFSVEEAPKLTYCCYVNEEAEYEVQLYFAPTNPVTWNGNLSYSLKVNENIASEYQIFHENYVSGTIECIEWKEAALNNIRICKSTHRLQKGKNFIEFGFMNSAIVLERVVLVNQRYRKRDTYLGPLESYFIS